MGALIYSLAILTMKIFLRFLIFVGFGIALYLLIQSIGCQTYDIHGNFTGYETQCLGVTNHPLIEMFIASLTLGLWALIELAVLTY